MAALQAIADYGFAHEWYSGVNLLTAVLLLLTFPGDVAILLAMLSSHDMPSAWGYAASIVVNGLAGFVIVFLWTEDEGTPTVAGKG